MTTQHPTTPKAPKDSKNNPASEAGADACQNRERTWADERAESYIDPAKPAHTPGPWTNNGGRIECDPECDPRHLAYRNRGVVAVVGAINNQSRQDTANANLITAAPETAAERDRLSNELGLARLEANTNWTAYKEAERLLNEAERERDLAREQVKTLLAKLKSIRELAADNRKSAGHRVTLIWFSLADANASVEVGKQ